MAFRRRAPQPFKRVPAGVEVRLGEPERELVDNLLGQLRDLITADPADPALRRLFPPAYHLADDADAEAEYQRLMHGELAASRLASIEAVAGLLHADRPLDDEEMLTLVQSVNAVRLVLGTLLDVDEDHDPRTVDPEDPTAGQHHLYAWLGYVLDSAISVLSAG